MFLLNSILLKWPSGHLKETLFVSILLCNFCYLTQAAYQHHHHNHQRCSDRLEAALKNIRRRSTPAQTSRLLADPSPYAMYHSIYSTDSDTVENGQIFEIDRSLYSKDFNRVSPIKRFQSHPDLDGYLNGYANHKQSSTIPELKVEVEDLRVKLPKSVSTRWVEVEKCKFSTANSTLDTRLIFPDLTISGRVIIQPTGEKCSLILRLRRAGIEFRTTPIGIESFGGEQSRRIGSASVRTDSHFAEPGFISVFAHSCQLTNGNHLRSNSKRQFSDVTANRPLQNLVTDLYASVPKILMGDGYSRKRGQFYNIPFDIRSESEIKDDSNDAIAAHRMKRSLRSRFGDNVPQRNSASDQIFFQDDVLNVGTEQIQDLIQPDARSFAELFEDKGGPPSEADEALTKDMENFFSMGVKGLLTTYMQKSLQPAIKETLMENMGYTLSYG